MKRVTAGPTAPSDLRAGARSARGFPMTAAINRVNVQGNAEQQAQQIRAAMATVFPEAVTLVREARMGLA